MMTASPEAKERMYWATDKSWYYLKEGKLFMRDDAPERAKKSFKAWRKAWGEK